MPRRLDTAAARARVVHPYAWLWEPLESDPTFVLRAMFGAKAVYLGGKMILCFTASEEPWRGLLVCTERTHQPALVADFPELKPHSILPKWLYLPESSPHFEKQAVALVKLARQRDPRIGIIPKPRKPSARRRSPLPGHP